MASFSIALHIVSELEGGYVNSPFDKGGETNYGITKSTAKRHGWLGSMKQLTPEIAAGILKKGYWDVMHLDDVYNQSIANELFSAGVVSGPGTASKLLQKSLNVLNRNSISWMDTIVDGIIGPKTMAVLNGLNEKDQSYLLRVFEIYRDHRYLEICELNAEQENNIRGWLNRDIKQED